MSSQWRFDYTPNKSNDYAGINLNDDEKRFKAESKAKRRANRKKKAKAEKKQKRKQQQQKVNAQKKGQEICMCGSTMILKQVGACRHPKNVKVCDDCDTALCRDSNVWECQESFENHPILCVECKIKRNEYEQILVINENINAPAGKEKKSPKKKKKANANKEIEEKDIKIKQQQQKSKVNEDTKNNIESMKQQINALERRNTELQLKCMELQQELQVKSASNALELKRVVTQYEDKLIVNDEEHTKSIQSYADIATKHANVLNEWKRTTFTLRDIAKSVEDKHITEIKANDDDEKVAPSFGGKLYQQYARCTSYMDQQAKRLKQSTSNQYLLELITKQNSVSEQVTINKAKSTFSDNDYRQCYSQYESVKMQRTELSEVIHDKVKQHNALMDKENELFQQMMQKKQMKEIADHQVEDLNMSSTKFISLIDGYNEFMNDTKKYMEQLTDYFNKEWDLFESKWWMWNADDIVAWFQFKTKKLNTHRIHWNNIAAELRKRGISGHSLSKFNDNTLDLIGLQDFDISTFVMSKIIDLRQKYKYQSDENVANAQNSTADDDKSIPSKFLCPLTKQIMKDPVIAFDGRTYEKEAIEKYLKLHKKSPITNAAAYTINTFPNMQLQEEIHVFCEFNQQMAMEEGGGDALVSQQEGAETALL